MEQSAKVFLNSETHGADSDDRAEDSIANGKIDSSAAFVSAIALRRSGLRRFSLLRRQMSSSFPPSKGGNTATADATALPEAGFAENCAGTGRDVGQPVTDLSAHRNQSRR